MYTCLYSFANFVSKHHLLHPLEAPTWRILLYITSRLEMLLMMMVHPSCVHCKNQSTCMCFAGFVLWTKHAPHQVIMNIRYWFSGSQICLCLPQTVPSLMSASTDGQSPMFLVVWSMNKQLKSVPLFRHNVVGEEIRAIQRTLMWTSLSSLSKQNSLLFSLTPYLTQKSFYPDKGVYSTNVFITNIMFLPFLYLTNLLPALPTA